MMLLMFRFNFETFHAENSSKLNWSHSMTSQTEGTFNGPQSIGVAEMSLYLHNILTIDIVIVNEVQIWLQV